MSEPNRPERPSRPPAGGKPPLPPNGVSRFGRNAFAWVIIISLAIALFVILSYGRRGGVTQIDYSQLLTAIDEGTVLEFVAQGQTEITGRLDAERTKILDRKNAKVAGFWTEVPPGTISYDFLKEVYAKNPGIKMAAENRNDLLAAILIQFLPWIVLIAAVYFFLFRQLKNSGGAGGMLGNFGRSKHRITSKEHTNVTFEDVAGIEEAKDEVREIVEFLKDPKRFQRLGGRIPRGVLLMGEPGTGKTLLAKAIAGEADVPFFSISGSDFVEMFVGVGASRVRDLFKQAKDNSPCIIFLDEIDAVGRRRGSGFSSGGHDEREQTLNAILVEMDGFETNDQVIVVAATNRLDVLDPALTRPGRFDRTVTVSLPDVKGRLEILKVHARKVKLGPNVDLAKLARATPGFSGADLAAIINESALGATLMNKDFIEHDDLEEARDKVRFGRARKSRVIDEKEKNATAYHEAGHAVVQYLLPDADPIHKVTIIPRGNYGGATMSLPEKDRSNYSKKWCIATLKTLFGGRIAEEMFCSDVNTGALGDIRMATGLARRMVRDWGMNDRLGFVFYGEDDSRPNFFDMGNRPEYSEETAKVIDEEVKKLIDLLYEQTRDTLEANKEKVDALAKALVKYETLEASDVERIMRGDVITRPTVSEMIDSPPSQARRPVVQPPDRGTPDLPPGAMPAPG
jgi:cell division protease FtsH